MKLCAVCFMVGLFAICGCSEAPTQLGPSSGSDHSKAMNIGGGGGGGGSGSGVCYDVNLAALSTTTVVCDTGYLSWGPLSYLTDSDCQTSFRTESVLQTPPSWYASHLDITLTSAEHVAVFRLYPVYPDGATYLPDRLKIYYRQDEVSNWIEIADESYNVHTWVPDGGNPCDYPEDVVLSSYNAKYWRVELLNNQDSWSGLAELEMYAYCD